MYVLFNFVQSHKVKLDKIQQNATSFIGGSRVSGLEWEFLMSWNDFHKKNSHKKLLDPSNYSFC